jgi:hypothetical protein
LGDCAQDFADAEAKVFGLPHAPVFAIVASGLNCPLGAAVPENQSPKKATGFTDEFMIADQPDVGINLNFRPRDSLGHFLLSQTEREDDP